MFIAHLPAAYLATALPGVARLPLTPLLIGSVVPDIDMLRFYLWDAGGVHHHGYLTHRPALWMAVLALGVGVRGVPVGRVLCAVGCGGVLHMGLDSVVGQIAWGWPLRATGHPLVVVPATQDWWVMSFVLHWTFAVELGLCALALCLRRRRVRQRRTLRAMFR